MRRHELTDEQFKKIELILPGRKGYVGVTAKDNRNFINGVLWIFKTGAPWRDLPERYGHWKNIHRRFSRWARAGIFDA
jgi:transposase